MKKSSRPLALVTAILAVGALLAGCASDAPAASAPPSPAADSAAVAHASPRVLDEGLGSDAADGVFPRTVTHFNGTTEIDAEPQRIVVISTGQLDSVLSLGIIPVGAARGDDAALVPDYLTEELPDLAARTEEIVDVGNRTNPDIESITELAPDLIFMNQAVLKEDWYAALSAIAPTMVTKGNGVNWKVDFLLMASALGRTGDAQDVLDAFHTDADDFASTLEDAAPTVSFLQTTGDRTRIMGVPSLAGGIAEDLGLARPESQQFDENSLDISVEELDLADADYLFYAGRDASVSTLTDAALWPTLAVVADGNAVEVDMDPFYFNAGPTAARVVLTDIIEVAGH